MLASNRQGTRLSISKCPEKEREIVSSNVAVGQMAFTTMVCSDVNGLNSPSQFLFDRDWMEIGNIECLPMAGS
jgi:hypothetical protein